MTEKEAINIVSEVIPKGNDNFEKLYRLYGSKIGYKDTAIDIFNKKWACVDIQALEKVTKMYLKDLKPDDYKPSFGSFLDCSLEEYIQAKQEEF